MRKSGEIAIESESPATSSGDDGVVNSRSNGYSQIRTAGLPSAGVNAESETQDAIIRIKNLQRVNQKLLILS